MKKSAIILVLSLICFNGISQISKQDSIKQIVAYGIGKPPVDLPPSSNDTYLRGNFQKVFTNSKIWNDFVTGSDKKYIWVESPETNWYDRTEGPNNSSKNDICPDPVMVDSTVINYYNTKINGFKYDSYTYEIEYQQDGTVREFYKFYSNDQKVKSFILGWNETELLTITEFNFEGRI